ncbi:hypothetical protein SAMN05216499_14722 [Actinacidiphila paucisporea]|uniref:Uncharacterized protein n=1 Tax=Actinacidiphila paucisporea TaxID=310782 RepID=A0A1M7QX15_9ACTN|nr:hypothetical protein SAMN05216499_14722 [Actinacidiphila paucisporea]
MTVLGDGTYLNCGMVTPHRKRPHLALLTGEEQDNAHRKSLLSFRPCGMRFEPGFPFR